ncbi:MAG: hypothetical protein M3N54_02290 [Acidobacteriota bacterium]|nr:hypothetical protein [Acidobacteriota bacterium]
MALTRQERERINDSRLKIQSITNTLNEVRPDKIPEYADIQDCLQNAEHSLTAALGAGTVTPG